MGQYDCTGRASSLTRCGGCLERSREARGIPEKTGAQFTLAVFDNWDVLHTAPIGLAAEPLMRTGGMLTLDEWYLRLLLPCPGSSASTNEIVG
jgi:hypothetical protein